MPEQPDISPLGKMVFRAEAKLWRIQRLATELEQIFQDSPALQGQQRAEELIGSIRMLSRVDDAIDRLMRLLYEERREGDKHEHETDRAKGQEVFDHYFLRVPPNMNTAREAVAWSFSIGAGEYHVLSES